jgi:hypothetical protein
VQPAEIVRASLDALGSAAAREAVRTLTAVADCTSPRGAYVTEVQSVRPDRVSFRQTWPDGGVFHVVAVGSEAWALDDETGTYAPAGPQLASAARAHEFQLLALELDRRLTGLEPGDPAELDDLRCRRVHGLGSLGERCTAWFDAETNRLVALDRPDPRPPEGGVIRTRFTGWQAVDGVLLADDVTVTDREGEFRLRFRELVPNAVDESSVAPP